MKYIIMCGGTYKRWETPRQLTEIRGEPIVARTIRLLRENGVSDIAISSNNPVFEQFSLTFGGEISRRNIQNRKCTLAAFLCQAHCGTGVSDQDIGGSFRIAAPLTAEFHPCRITVAGSSGGDDQTVMREAAVFFFEFFQ